MQHSTSAFPHDPDPASEHMVQHARADGASPPVNIGRYLVSPLTKPMANGWFASSVSIKSGSGSETTDRVLRLTRVFQSAAEAAAYAMQEGRQWISAARTCAGTPAGAAA
jgi:hypothetical protein